MKKNEDNLNLIFKDKKQEKIFDSIWKKIRELISEFDKFDNYSKEYTVVSFDSNDVLEYGTTIYISTTNYPQVHLNTCQYKND